ncbi:DNA-binding transcriptional regulator, XRE-family HTH domain [Thermanaeromonas toyohensis ToBE]|uniref:DNA-binding transcriptional regulator, XRE-family HTH domain n=1 Tax=Thermanaeromonas toyohensis ToBE TaxID=698762 RepID=A0A1W1VYA2_9FIRM|nr:helix-turn-helix transcriptional regulator [Thermanaeromonas toyohensis]SMB97834.1 DNA-binding transcriptional regulator, XRE-family HTH domain [Thermanaeromonas toyohensis ToBE]
MPKPLKEVRIRKKLTQAELARAVGLAQSTIANYEMGRRIPRLHIAQKIAKVLGTRVDNIIFGREGCEMTTDPTPDERAG